MARVTNEQIIAKLDQLVDVLTANAVREPVPTVATATPAPQNTNGVPQVTEQYRDVMIGKAQAYADKHNGETVLYAKHNKHKEVKLAFSLRPAFAAKVPNGYLGTIAVVTPSS